MILQRVREPFSLEPFWKRKPPCKRTSQLEKSQRQRRGNTSAQPTGSRALDPWKRSRRTLGLDMWESGRVRRIPRVKPWRASQS